MKYFFILFWVQNIILGERTIRGCLGDMLKLTGLKECSGENCKQCSTKDCNSEVVPSKRAKCYQCDDAYPKCNNDVTLMQSKVCVNYSKDQKCYTSISKGIYKLVLNYICY